MDPLSVTASIIAVLQLSTKVLAYLHDVKTASKDRAQCAIEVSNLSSLLTRLRFLLEDADASQPWCSGIRDLTVKNGPLDQFKDGLTMLHTRMSDGGRLKKASENIMWKIKKEETASILAQMERLKEHVELVINMDHLYVFTMGLERECSLYTKGNSQNLSKVTSTTFSLRFLLYSMGLNSSNKPKTQRSTAGS
jgi:hypothetical protein